MKYSTWGMLFLFCAYQASAQVQAQTYSKADTIEYYDDSALWVLGQVKRTTTSGIETSKTEFGWKALPWKKYRFGKLQQTLTYDTTSTVVSGQLGAVKTIQDGNNNITTLSSWKRGIPQSIKYPITPESPTGAVQSAMVNNNGEIDWVTGETGAKTCYTYDPMGRLASITHPSETTPGACDTTQTSWKKTNITFQPIAVEEYGVPAGHWRQVITTGNANKITYFDALWRPLVTKELDATSATTETLTKRFQRMAYDKNGRSTFASYPGTTDALTTGTWTEYDALGRTTLVKQNSELGVLSTKTEYLTGFQTRVTSPKGQQTTSSYMAYDQPTYDLPVAITHPAGAYTDITRHVLGYPMSIKRRDVGSTLAVARTFVYDSYRQLCKSLEPETGATVMHYDAFGNLDWSAAGLALTSTSSCQDTDASIAARKISRTYDARNRVKTLTFPDGQGNQAWVYTPDGLPAQITTYNFTGNTSPVVNAYTYNKRRLLTGESAGFSSKLLAIGYDYNTLGALASQTYPSGFVVDYAPNALGQPAKAGTFANNVTYFPNGALKQFNYGNGIVHTMTQNARGLPDTSCDFNGSCTASAVLFDAYDYDANGNVASISDGRTNHRGDRTMTYDNLDRLTQVKSAIFGAGAGQLATYSYDVLDNLTGVTVGGSQPRIHNYCYDANNRLTNIKTGGCAGATVTGLGYDPQGNLANKNGVLYKFDYGNRLRSVTGQEIGYLYDGYGRRVSATSGTTNPRFRSFVYSQNGQLLYEENSGSNSKTENIYLGGSLVASRSLSTNIPGAQPKVSYKHTDALGTPVAATDASKALITAETSEYEPYGLLVNRPLTNGIGYTGHMQDASTGLTYMQQRYYDPGIGRFLSVDPVTANSGTGASFNRYWYANNNSYKFTDPDGRYVCTASNRVCVRIERAAQVIHKAAAKAGPDSRLAKISAFLGEAGIVNGVSINDKVTKPGNAGDATREQNGVHIGINMAKLSTGDKVASVLVHEGSHGVDHMDPRISKQMNDDVSRSALTLSELRGGESQAKLFQALGRQEPFKLYSPTNGINWDGINSQADRSVDQICHSANPCNP